MLRKGEELAPPLQEREASPFSRETLIGDPLLVQQYDPEHSHGSPIEVHPRSSGQLESCHSSRDIQSSSRLPQLLHSAHFLPKTDRSIQMPLRNRQIKLDSL